jgi:hypothetical protein
MTTKAKQGSKSLAVKESGSSGSLTVSSLAKDVNATNYEDKAKAFMKLNVGENGKLGFMISTENRMLMHGDRLIETLHEWGAWRAYFVRLGLRLTLISMDRRGYWMVPAQWPHQFAASETAEVDYAAGNVFNEEWQDRRAKERMRAPRLASGKSFPYQQRPKKTPDSFLDKPKRQPGIDVDQLLADYEKDKADQDKRDEEKRRK